MSGRAKVIVAGGTGLIGKALVSALAADGTEIVVLSRHPERESLPGARTVGWNGTTVAPEWAGELAGAAGVVNVAGASIGGGRWTKRRKELILASRTGSTGALVDAIGSLAPSERPPVLVNASGIDYTGSGEDEVDESASRREPASSRASASSGRLPPAAPRSTGCAWSACARRSSSRGRLWRSG